MKFGSSVAIENNSIVCGAPGYSGDPGNYNPYPVGAAFTFEFKNGSWVNTGPILESSQSQCGTSVTVSNGIVLAGMPGWNDNRGKVYIDAVPYRFVYDEDPNLNYNFGGVVAAHNGQYVVTSTIPVRHGRVFFGLVE